MKFKTFALTAALLAGTLPAYADFMMGPPPGAEEAFETVLSYTDEATAETLQTQQDTVADLRTQLEEALAAEEVDSDAVSDLRSLLREARHELGDDIRDIVDSNDELQTALQEQREAARTERAITGYALRDDEAYASLLEAASDDQASTLETNQQAIEDLKTAASEARESGATRDEMREYREQIRTLMEQQAEVVSEVLDSNEELQTEFSSAAEEMVADMRPSRGGHRGRGGM